MRPEPDAEVIEQRLQQSGERGPVRGRQACHEFGLPAEHPVHRPLDYIERTDFFRGRLTDRRRDDLITATANGRPGIPEDVTGTVLFLASPAARHVTGQVIAVNGGARTTR